MQRLGRLEIETRKLTWGKSLSTTNHYQNAKKSIPRSQKRTPPTQASTLWLAPLIRPGVIQTKPRLNDARWNLPFREVPPIDEQIKTKGRYASRTDLSKFPSQSRSSGKFTQSNLTSRPRLEQQLMTRDAARRKLPPMPEKLSPHSARMGLLSPRTSSSSCSARRLMIIIYSLPLWAEIITRAAEPRCKHCPYHC